MAAMTVVPNDVPVCATCGVQQDPDRPLPEVCRICADARQYVGWGGQRWTSTAELAAGGTRMRIEEDHGVWGVGAEPAVAIGQRALLVPGEGGNLLWDCVGFLDADGVRRITELGGIAAIAISHPHFYGCAVDVSEAFGGVPIHLHAADAEWVQRPGTIHHWEGERHEVLPGRTLLNAGVHFPGGTVLHWADGADGRGALCTGDILMVVMDRRWVSFMRSYPNYLPEHPDVVRRAVALVEEVEFDRIYGGWWGRVAAEDGRAVVRRSADRYLQAIGQPPLGAGS